MNFIGDLFGSSEFIVILKLIVTTARRKQHSQKEARQIGGGLFTGFKVFFLNSVK
jgi:uncharacterized membrane protein